MPDVLAPATTGRSKCRGCGRPIANGALRFGEGLANNYGEGESLYWFHVSCAACLRSEKLEPLVRATLELPERDGLLATIESGLRHPKLTRLLRAERASSGRATCRACRETIPKDTWRLALAVFEEGRYSPIGTIHLACARNYFGTADILERLERMSPDMTAEDGNELARLLPLQREAPPAEPEQPGLAKTQGERADPDSDALRRARASK